MAKKPQSQTPDLKQTSWDLRELFASDDDPDILKERNLLKMKTEDFVEKWRGREDYLQDAQVLWQALEEYENWLKYTGTSGKQGFYFGLRRAQDQLDPNLKAKENKLHEFAVKLGNEMEFFGLSLAKISKEKQKEFLSEPLLKKYRHYLEKTFQAAKYLLSEKEERILNLKAKTSYANWVSMVSELLSQEEREVTDEDGKKRVKNFSQLLTLTVNKEKKTRLEAAQALEDIFQKHLAVIEREMNSILEDAKIEDDLRGYERPDKPRHLSDDVETEVVDKLVETVSASFDISKDFYRFKAKLLGEKHLAYFEKAVEYGDLTSKYPYQEAASLVWQTLKGLDDEFSEIFQGFAENGQLDVFPRKGKVHGAFCSSNKSILPTYILLNHNDKLNDVLTLAHEVGHGIHFELIKKNENEINTGVSTAVAEVASTFMEDFVLQKLLQKADEEEKLAIMTRKLDADLATIQRQIAFYNFEMDLHMGLREKGYLTKEEISELFQKRMVSYLGKTGEGSNLWWTYVPHFRNYFYVYTYASGLLISKYFQKLVHEDPSEIKTVKEMLSVGSSKSPQQLFMDLGLDIRKKDIWEDGLQEIRTYLQQTKELAEKLGKI
jgi:oligoendopeptidase F